MYDLNPDNLRDVTETIMGDSEYTLHALYALKFMAENLHADLAVDDIFITEGSDGLTSGLFQKLANPDKSYYLGFVDLYKGLTAIAKGFAGDQFEDSHEFILDAAGETINRINGDFVIAQTKSGIEYSIEPQISLDSTQVFSVISPTRILHIPIKIGDCKAEILFISL